MELSRGEKFVDVNLLDLEKVRGVGVGGDDPDSVTFDVVHLQSGRIYALKEFKAPSDLNQRAEVRREFERVKGLDNPNLVKCYQLFETGEWFSLLLEHMDRGSVVDTKNILTLKLLAAVAYRVLVGLDYLHQNRISHGEIKLSNIFVDSAKGVKVLYLGKSMSMSRSPMKFNEIRAIHDEFSWDLCNLGLCVLKLYSGLYGGRIRDNDSGYVREACQESLNEMWRFLCCCMGTNLSGRWTAKDLVSHPFFKRNDIGDLSGRWTAKDPVSHTFFELKSVEASTLTMVSELDIHRRHIRLNKRKSTTSHEEEKQISPKKAKSEMSIIEVNDSIDIKENSGDSARKRLSMPDDSSIKRCTQHCALFLPDCEFEKNKLIQMWIAEECIEVEGRQRAEDVASLWFDDLVHREVIKPSSFDNLHEEMRYKVNTCQLSTLELGGYLRIDEGQLGEIRGEALHLRLSCKTFDQTLSTALKSLKQLRTLRLVGDRGSPIKQLPNGIFLGLTELRTVDLSHGYMIELPGSLGEVKSLRYLDVSGNPIKKLPESTARLSHLQTVKLTGCFELVALPREFKNLKKLRHLDLEPVIIRQLKCMPKGMGGLIELQTLKAFVVGKDDGFGIGELKEMNEITGSFCISGLENISSAEEAKKAALVDKKHIEKLELRWDDDGDGEDATNTIELLQPHFHLKELEIVWFHGSKLPSWISNPAFVDLSRITLFNCTGCHSLPSVGELPSLKLLEIFGMKTVRNISTLFCTSNCNKNSGAFSRLEKLTMEDMPKLEEWSGIKDGDFPCLRHMSIIRCPKLVLLPSMSCLYSLQHLELIRCVELTSLPEGVLQSSLETLIIRDCSKVIEQCCKDGGNDWFKTTNLKEVMTDFQYISLD